MNADALRPIKLEEFAGQAELTHDLEILLKAAKMREQLPDHLLFSGPPGLGKTTLANIIASEVGLNIIHTSGPAIIKPAELAAILTSMRANTLLFIDEIHALDRKVEELLYSAMEDYVLDIVIGEGLKTRSVRINLEPFVLVAATTQAGLLSAPLRDRFGFQGRLKLYSEQDLKRIIERSAKLLNIDITPEAALILSSRSRGTPRIANRLLRRVRDYHQVHATGDGEVIDEREALKALDAYGIDNVGLDSLARDIITTLIQSFGGGPVGLNALAAAVGEAPSTLEEVYEPYLMRIGFLQRTPRGRVATIKAYEHLSIEPLASFTYGISTAPSSSSPKIVDLFDPFISEVDLS